MDWACDDVSRGSLLSEGGVWLLDMAELRWELCASEAVVLKPLPTLCPPEAMAARLSELDSPWPMDSPALQPS